MVLNLILGVMDLKGEYIVPHSEDKNWDFKGSKGHTWESKVEVNWAGEASKEIILIDPILNDEDEGEDDGGIGRDIGEEGDNKDIDNIVSVPISEIELGILQQLI